MTKKLVRDSLEDQFIVVCIVGNCYLVCGPQLESFSRKEMFGVWERCCQNFPKTLSELFGHTLV